jgi:acetyl/propionyl-CoA carboxylase alpha subunit
MFKKILIANRGEIAVRVIRACKELGIRTVAVYTETDSGSLHVRLCDECALLDHPSDFLNPERIVELARAKGADGIHPGCGFLAEQPEFLRAADEAGIRVIGPSRAAAEAISCRLAALNRAREAGFPTVDHSPVSYLEGDFPALWAEAGKLGYPLLVKSCSGGRGPGERMVQSPDRLESAVLSARLEALSFFHQSSLYLEKAVLPAYEVGVQVLRDGRGQSVQFGEYQSLVQHGNRRVISESPAPVLSPRQRDEIREAARDLANLFGVENAATVEFLVGEDGRFYFAEIKAGLQLEHPLFEMLAQVDLVHAQIRLAGGEQLPFGQQEISMRGSALLCKINAEDPWNAFLPSPGRIRRMWLPGGPNVRVDTYVYAGCQVPGNYDPSVAKLTVWGADRQSCIDRMRCALDEFNIAGIETNLSLLQSILSTSEFGQGRYSTDFQAHPCPDEAQSAEDHLRDLAVAAAVIQLLREQCQQSPIPDRSGMNLWRRSLRIPSPWSYMHVPNEKNGSHP